ncbi:hypothetical protein ABZ446_20170 [Streptomyces sp. NPDC005813]|uniref:hypothetical protein n=1 Tax=Streptomyces sp. NPDC005813 TaxID=3155592 RepID=UPI003406F1FF
MPFPLFLMVFGVTAMTGGGWVAFDVRGASAALEAHQQRNHELRAAAAGTFDPPDKWITARGFRVVGAVVGLCGVILVLAGVAELLTGG